MHTSHVSATAGADPQPGCPIADKLGIPLGAATTVDDLIELLGHDDEWLRELLSPFDGGGLSRAEVDAVVTEWADKPRWVLEVDVLLDLLADDDDTFAALDEAVEILDWTHHIDGVSIDGRWIDGDDVHSVRDAYLRCHLRRWVETAERCGYPAVEDGASLDDCSSYHGPHVEAEDANMALARTLCDLGFRDNSNPYKSLDYQEVWDGIIKQTPQDVTLEEALND